MIQQSDNLATNLVIELLGAPRVDQLARELGATGTKILRGVQDLKAFDAGLNNKTTAADMLRLMVACRDSPHFSRDSRRQMMEILRGQRIRSLIAAGLPPDAPATLASKTGSISSAKHDAGIVEFPDRRAYALVLMTWGWGDEGDAAARAAAAVSRLIYDRQAAETVVR